MAKVTVTAEDNPKRVLLAEQVNLVHLDDEHCAGQFLERLAWALNEAEDDPQPPPSTPYTKAGIGS